MGEPVDSKKVIAVEGHDEVNFFESLLKVMGISDVEIYDVAGKNQFKTKLPALTKQTGFSKVEAFAVIRDADDNAENAFQSIKNCLKKSGLLPPKQMNTFSTSQKKPDVGIFIMPGDSDGGMLEDLCLKTVKNNPLIKCVDEFIQCCKPDTNHSLESIAKRKAQAFLAVTPELANSVGLGAKKGCWNFNSKQLDELKTFLDKFNF